MKIKKVYAREILDSEGVPTIESEVTLEDGSIGIASVPAGGSKGKNEALELRDNDPGRFNGLGVLKAVATINNQIGPRIVGMEAAYQGKIDQFLIDLDGTERKSRLGANSILSISQAVLEASALSYKLPIHKYLEQKYRLKGNDNNLPTPTFNLINGGKHSEGNLDFQEFHLIPTTRKSYHEALACGIDVYQALKGVLSNRGISCGIGDEGGFVPNLYTNMDALEILVEGIEAANYQFARDAFLGLDCAASYFYKGGKYQIRDRLQPFNRREMIDYYQGLDNQYQLFSLEDGLDEDDWEGWVELTKTLAKDTLIVADDLICTNKRLLQKAIKKNAATAVLVKPNQTGTISEAINVIDIARKAGWKVIVSHRSGETNDDFIADFAVGVGADYTKFGAPARGERVAKYNRLLEIEREIQSKN